MSSGFIEITLEGMDELKRKLEAIPDNMRKRLFRKALNKAAKIIRDTAKAHVPVLAPQTGGRAPNRYRKKGTVKRNIRVAPSKYAMRQGNVGVYIGVRKLHGARTRTLGRAGARNPNDPFYYTFLERGTRKMTARQFIKPAAARLEEAGQIFIDEATIAINALNGTP